MAEIAQFTDPIVAAIYEQYEKAGEAEKSRNYVGASMIGHECSRRLWYDFRWARKEIFEGRMLRLFQTGHLAESRFVADLRSIGATVHDVDPATGDQFGFHDFGGHARGHMDGCAQNIPTGGKQWHVVEFKTHGDKSFVSLKKDGVKKAKYQHYAQMTWYMGKSGMQRALYLAVNKNNDELYSERIEFDMVEFEKIQAKFEKIIFAVEPPAKLRDDPKYYMCNSMCIHKDVCHGHQVPDLSCRTCCHATPEREGDRRWSCAKFGPEIPLDVQRKGCAYHIPLPFLVTYADPTDAGEGWIEFKRKDNGEVFVVTSEHDANNIPTHKPTGFIYLSSEIAAAKDHRAICDHGIEKIKQAFPGSRITQ